MVMDSVVDLRLGDCLEILPTLEAGSVDAVVTDPPYGVQAAKWDDEIPPQEVLDHCLRISRGPVIWFGAAPVRCIAPTMQYNPLPSRCLIWHVTFSLARTNANGMFYRWHPIWCWNLPSGRTQVNQDVIRESAGSNRKTEWWHHPGTKPIKLMTRLVSAWGGESVLDPFMGSGTTGVACVQTGRNFVGIEIDPGYFEIAKRRIEEAQLQMRMDL